MSGRFVVLRHELPPAAGRPSHWDLLLESGPVLRAWALDAAPGPAVTTTAQRLADHRLVYLDYEGPISGDRGSVTRTDAGTYRVVSEDAGRLTIELAGSTYRGMVELEEVGDGCRVTCT